MSSSEFTYEQFLDVHEPQLLASAVPERFWPSLFRKLVDEDLDAGDAFQIIVEQDEEGETQSYGVRTIKEISADDPNNIFLIDHAWTFRPSTARLALQEVPRLKERLLESFGVKLDDLTDADSMAGSDYIGSESGDAKRKPPRSESEKKKNENDVDSDHSTAPSSIAELEDRIIKTVLSKLWSYANTYSVKVKKSVVSETDMPIWYIPDEFGIKIGHSNTPTVSVSPFFFAFKNIAYSILFPIQNIPDDSEVTRNYLVNAALLNKHPDWEPMLMLPWQEGDFSDRSITFSTKDDSYFMDGRIADQLPKGSQKGPAKDLLGILDTVKIYANDGLLTENLKNISFELVDDIYKADIIWTREHFHDFAGLAENNPTALVNQFPYESCLTVKDLFAACLQSHPKFISSYDPEKLEFWPTWYPASFNLNEELPAFVAYYQKRRQHGMDNSWIVKSWNLARGMDITITDDLNCIIRLSESGPKLVSKYIEQPVLFRRPDNGNFVKFDLRYIVFLRSVDPLDVQVYSKFWPRCAIRDFDMSTLDDVFSHLSVHNYSAKEQVLNIRCEDFIDHLQKLHPQIKWDDVQKKVDALIKDVFEIVTTNKPPRGIAPNLQSRALYGFDIMLKWKDDDQKEVEVVFLEANFIPDCQRACDFYPDFYDTVVQTLFLGGGSDKTRAI
ncbi:hypothetical protein M3Y94_00637900 [Aphelenchoides besseyi]|nr:hypothetical protein M3Y94_00637900 [Aphelenchoides besseyi]KAI6230993.1 hypothetical protein M3Y95_00334600 [Aphelenchoides besseyi]